MKNEEFEFIVDVPPDRETIINFHKVIARGLIKKYGEATMREVVKQIEEKKQ